MSRRLSIDFLIGDTVCIRNVRTNEMVDETINSISIDLNERRRRVSYTVKCPNYKTCTLQKKQHCSDILDCSWAVIKEECPFGGELYCSAHFTEKAIGKLVFDSKSCCKENEK